MAEVIVLVVVWMHFCAQLGPPVVERVPRASARTRGWIAASFVRFGQTP